jgi:hypothetical protein
MAQTTDPVDPCSFFSAEQSSDPQGRQIKKEKRRAGV